MSDTLSYTIIEEQKHFDRLVGELGENGRSQIVDEVSYKNNTFPIKIIEVGSDDPEAPVIAYFGGVHGLERIGAQVVLAYLETIVKQLAWDNSLKHTFKSIRMLFMPIVNPVGIWQHSRSNGNGVDLMRNSPSVGFWPQGNI